MKDRIKVYREKLLPFYINEGPERCGFITDKVIEVKNTAEEPMEGFQIASADIIKYTELPECWATWHTHPNAEANLSGKDYVMFRNWAKLYHFIVGSDGVKCFKFDEEKNSLLEIF